MSNDSSISTGDLDVRFFVLFHTSRNHRLMRMRFQMEMIQVSVYLIEHTDIFVFGKLI